LRAVIEDDLVSFGVLWIRFMEAQKRSSSCEDDALMAVPFVFAPFDHKVRIRRVVEELGIASVVHGDE
jgi:hypothetical protein